METSLAANPISLSQWVQCLLVMAFVTYLLYLSRNK
jgi:hypothetical protein